MEASHAPSASSGDPLIGVTLDGRYTVVRRIGEGGMGIVYEAQHAIIGKRVALKVLRRDYSSRTDVVERFKQEAQSASRVDSPHIIDISDFGETPEGDSYFVMEFLEGEDLSNRIREGQSLDADLAVKIAIQCCDALGAAHAAHIVHRDMKPENIFLTNKRGDPNFVKIVDFGIAKMNDVSADAPTMKKLTKTGMIFGTPEYMSPEQAGGKRMDHRVDVYAMGIILYEMFAGTVPFLGDTFMGVLTQHLFDAPPSMKETNPNAQFPEAIESIIWRCLQKEPDDRFQSMDELGEALRACQNPEAAAVVSGSTQMGWAGSDTTAPVRVPRMLSPEDARASEFPPVDTRSRVPMMLLALLLGGTVLGVGVWFWSQRTDAGTLVAQANPNEGSDEVIAVRPESDTPKKERDELPTGEAVADGVAEPAAMYSLSLEIEGYRKAEAVVSSLDGRTILKTCKVSCAVKLEPAVYTVLFKSGRKVETRSVMITDGDVTETFKRGSVASRVNEGTQASASEQTKKTGSDGAGAKADNKESDQGLTAKQRQQVCEMTGDCLKTEEDIDWGRVADPKPKSP